MRFDLQEKSDKTVAEQLRDALSKAAVRVIDLFRDWDDDQSGTVSKKEFRKASYRVTKLQSWGVRLT